MDTQIPSEIITESELRRLAFQYARAMDRCEPDLLEVILSEDVVIEGPDFHVEGLVAVRELPLELGKMFVATQHAVHNQTVTVQGDKAEGETYCTASHILQPEAGTEAETHQALVWTVRYLDRFVRGENGWQICHRRLIIDWTEMRPVSMPAAISGDADE